MTVPLYGLGAKPSSLTQDEIIHMALKAGFSVGLDDPIIYAAHERFGALVAAHEREQCAKVVEDGVLGHGECAAAIRARGKK